MKIPDRSECLKLLAQAKCSDEVIQHCETVSELAVRIGKRANAYSRCDGKCGSTFLATYGIAKQFRSAKRLSIRGVAEGESEVDTKLIEAGALLHDIGRAKTHGIAHAMEGAKIARQLKLDRRIVLIIERHIGAGIEKKEAKVLGLPEKNYIPKTLEEKIVAHADNLIAGNRKQKLSDAIKGYMKRGRKDIAERIIELHNELSRICKVDLDEI